MKLFRKIILSFFCSFVFLFSYAQDSSGTCEAQAYNLLCYATKFKGTPYVYGGSSPRGFDCSGFVMYSFQSLGINLPHSSKGMANVGVHVDKALVKIGDILIFTGSNASIRVPGHVGIVLTVDSNKLTFIHASSSAKHGGVTISSLYDTYYIKRFLEFRSIINCK